MKKILLLLGILLAFATTLQARYSARAVESCQAYNDLRHSRNSRHLALKPGKSYTVLQHHKGQYLVKFEHPFATQRWVDDSCLKSGQTHAAPKESHTALPKTQSGLNSLLVLSWQNSFCRTHSHRKECRPLFNRAANHLVLHGLWPQPRSRVYCNVPARLQSADRNHRLRSLPPLKFSSDLRQAMQRYFPGALSGLDRHEWIKHGSCYDPDPGRYFGDALSLTAQVDRSSVGEYLRSHIGHPVTLAQLRQLFEKDFGRGSGNKLALRCHRGKISEISISLRGKGSELSTLLKGAGSLHSRCVQGIVEAR
ncbi:hypothetical protein [Nitratifractor sp.]|uniref:ribonuclease T2 family protein n=1 Tax=Nitratifractor sp. TaxID=2268144 RepID=UPI0025CF1240|nr:hypothetical protein [Nitratifractor sp.]